VQLFNGAITFGITHISVQKVVGHEKHVGMMLTRDCKYPNSIDIDNFNYFNYFLFDALLNAPQYGEVLKQDENGNFENVASFARPFKKHQLSSMLLPEPVADALAQLNTFDQAEIYDGHKHDLFVRNSSSPAIVNRSIQIFETKMDWQNDANCYTLAIVGFDENLNTWDSCCDDAGGVLPCFDPDGESFVQPAIEVTQEGTHFHIALSNTPVGMEGTMVQLLYSTQDVGDYTNCEGVPTPSQLAGIEMSYTDFAANGIDFYGGDLAGKVFKFSCYFTQVGCDSFALSTEACSEPCLYIIEATGWCYTRGDFPGGATIYDVTAPITIATCGLTDITVELFSTAISDWFEPVVYTYPLPDGSSTPHFDFDNFLSGIISPSDITKMRLKRGTVYSNEVVISLGGEC
jgi:hypothetical protein